MEALGIIAVLLWLLGIFVAIVWIVFTFLVHGGMKRQEKLLKRIAEAVELQNYKHDRVKMAPLPPQTGVIVPE